MDPYRNYNPAGHPHLGPPHMDPLGNPYGTSNPGEFYTYPPPHQSTPYPPPYPSPYISPPYTSELEHSHPFPSPLPPHMHQYEVPPHMHQYEVPPHMHQYEVPPHMHQYEVPPHMQQYEFPPHQEPPYHASVYPPMDPFPYAPAGISPSPYPPYKPEPPSSYELPAQPFTTERAYSPVNGSAYTPYNLNNTQLPQGKLVKIICKADRNFNLAIRHDELVMVPSDPNDDAQLWIKDDTPGIRVKDRHGFPAFFLVNKGHKKLLKHVKDKGNQILLVDYDQDILDDDDVLWTESQDFGEGYKTIRLADNPLLNMTVSRVDKKLGAVEDGSPITLDTWHKHDSQLWKILPLC